MLGDLVIGIDSSTTATKAIAWDGCGLAVAESRVPVPLSMPRPDWFEQDAIGWWSTAVQTLRELSTKIGMSRVAALAISNQRETFTQFDAQRNPLRPATFWLDSRATAEVIELSSTVGADRIHQITGKPAGVVPCIYRCAWFARHMPGMWRTMAITSEVHGYLTFKLTGRWIASTDPMGLLDLTRQDWSGELLATVGLDRPAYPPSCAPVKSWAR